ncbi:MAG: hypothetical protein B6I23_02440 [Rickettsiaceae bacterium 4572_127]|nr:MAG: hypothetical protein B6I23_02440 [Rickettsiaceae bacterium 4572_127]
MADGLFLFLPRPKISKDILTLPQGVGDRPSLFSKIKNPLEKSGLGFELTTTKWHDVFILERTGHNTVSQSKDQNTVITVTETVC